MAEPQIQTVKVVEVCLELSHCQPPQSFSLSPSLIYSGKGSHLFSAFSSIYEVSDSPNTSLYESNIPTIKHSLSLTLHHFLPLCGHLNWPQDSPKPVLNYVDGEGVLLTITESTMDFHHLSGNHVFRDVMKCLPPIPHLQVSHEQASVIALQVTVFPNTGFCIGIATHDAVLDGKSSTSFVKSWAQICRTGSVSLGPDLAPIYHRTAIKDPAAAGLESIYLDARLKHGKPNNRSLMIVCKPIPAGAVRATFELSREDIEKLRTSICAASICLFLLFFFFFLSFFKH